METARKGINRGIMDNKKAREYYNWLLKELSEINKLKFKKCEKTGVVSEKQNPLGKVAKLFHQYCKAIHSLDHIRWSS